MDPNVEDRTPHCLLLPYPNQGHINPILQFAKRLSHTRRRIQITFILTKFLLKSTTAAAAAAEADISFRSISDGFDDGGRAHAKSFEEYTDRFELVGRETLTELLRELSDSGRPVDCVVYDPFIPWVLDVAKGFGLPAAAFFTQSCAVNSVYHQVYCGRLRPPLRENEVAVVAAELPPLKAEELPSFIEVHGSYPVVFEMIKSQFRNVEKADWIFVNTFYKLEEKIINSLSEFWPIKAIGPSIPSMCLDKRLQDDEDYGLSLFEPSLSVCLNWLDKHESKSVIYISFGSLVQLTIEQTQELSQALMILDKPFIWIVRKSEESKLPNNFPPENGLIVSWGPQLKVLGHDAIGCFITHCGWNSTLEALSLGVPMVAMPQWTDQNTNAKFVTDIWKVGVWAKKDCKGIVKSNVIIDCVEHVMEDGEEIRKNAIMWKEFAREAVDKGGSSDTNIEDFIITLKEKNEAK
ncbi:UDP-glycosyltransferase 74F2-like isoform X2 [Andrographis paniculata]|uniref:Glycosyltransferase n=1 Tax=Andrographis paniculata TaxID=175694 RepID=A0A8E3S6A8_ANDPA|nr:UDP-glycosyltransferase 74F2-like isoform X2 [Andrographis paniculata]QDA11333.1 UDP-glycosyltransferase [Andrographis paniculata]